jgi:hypothetical protein
LAVPAFPASADRLQKRKSGGGRFPAFAADPPPDRDDSAPRRFSVIALFVHLERHPLPLDENSSNAFALGGNG